MTGAKKKRYIWLVIYGLLMVLLGLYLYFVNDIVVSMDTTMNRVEKLRDIPATSGAAATFHLMDVSVDQDRLQSMTVEGSARCETDLDRSAKHIDLLLVGKKHLYRVGTVLDREIFASDEEGAGLDGFVTTFPTIALKNDVYTLGLCVWENETDNAFVDLRSKWVKSSRGMRAYIPGEVDPVFPNDDGEISFMLNQEVCVLEDKFYSISGFAVKLDHDSAASNVYVTLTFEDGSVRTYETTLFPHPWYKQYLESELYTFSYFTAKLPKKDLLDKTVKLDILVDNDGVSMYRGGETWLRFTEAGVEEVRD